MTGKQLKDFSARVPDEAVIEVREKGYQVFQSEFELRAVLTIQTKRLEEAEI